VLLPLPLDLLRPNNRHSLLVRDLRTSRVPLRLLPGASAWAGPRHFLLRLDPIWQVDSQWPIDSHGGSMNRDRLIELVSAGPVITEKDWHRMQHFQPRPSIMYHLGRLCAQSVRPKFNMAGLTQWRSSALRIRIPHEWVTLVLTSARFGTTWSAEVGRPWLYGIDGLARMKWACTVPALPP
jgi:hypothetical protein